MWARITLLGIVGLLCGTRPGLAADSQAFNMFDGAKKVVEILMTIAPSENAFSVREFRGLSSSNLGLSKLVADRLTQAGRSVSPDALTELTGELHRLPQDESQPLTGFNILGSVRLSNGSTRRFSVDVMNRDDAHSTVTDTGETSRPPDLQRPGGAQSLPTIVGTEIRPSPESPYGVEILVEAGPGQYRPLTPRSDGSLIRVDLRAGDIYAVRLHNRTDFDAAVEVLIDGLGRFTFADDPVQSNGRDLVRPRSDRTITGYYRDAQVVDSFQVGEHSKSLAAQSLSKSIEIGCVTCTFAAAWKPGDPVPPFEPDVAKSAAPLGTAKGPPRRDPTERVERLIGSIRAVVKVRY
jgi:hypothetical protein